MALGSNLFWLGLFEKVYPDKRRERSLAMQERWQKVAGNAEIIESTDRLNYRHEANVKLTRAKSKNQNKILREGMRIALDRLPATRIERTEEFAQAIEARLMGDA